jgi:hypothetical protein
MTVEPDCIAAILGYLVRGILPTNTTEVRRLVRRAKAYLVVGEHLYKRSMSGILQKCIPCIPHEQGQQMVREIHGGICGHHAVPRLLVGKAF